VQFGRARNFLSPYYSAFFPSMAQQVHTYFLLVYSKKFAWKYLFFKIECALKLHQYMKTGLIGLTYNCEANGNYKNYQCTESVCYCVNEAGRAIAGTNTHIADLRDLECADLIWFGFSIFDAVHHFDITRHSNILKQTIFYF